MNSSQGPVLSEAVAFRWFTYVLVAAAVVIAAALLIDPVVGAAVLAAEIVAAVWLLLRVRHARRAGPNDRQ